MATDLQKGLLKANSILNDPAVKNIGTVAGITALVENHMDDLKGLGVGGSNLLPGLLVLVAVLAANQEDEKGAKNGSK